MEKLTEDRREIFTDIYRYYEKYWDMPDKVESWAEAAAEMCRIATKHGNTPLVVNLLNACYWAIDAETKLAREAIENGRG